MMRVVLLFQANIGLLLILSIHCETPTSQPNLINMKSSGDETNKMPRIELRAVMVPCSTKCGDSKEIEQFIKDMASDKENTKNKCSDKSKSTLYSDVVECRRKMLITMQINNCGRTRCEEEYIIVDHIFDVISKQKVRFLNPLVFKIKQEPILQSYSLNAQHVVNGEATEEVINKQTVNYTGCDDSTQNPTCGFTYHKDTMIPYSQGFCCSCDASVNKGRQPSLSSGSRKADDKKARPIVKEEIFDPLGVNKRATNNVKNVNQVERINGKDCNETSKNLEHKISKGRHFSKNCSSKYYHALQNNKRETSQRYKRKVAECIPMISETTEENFGFVNKHLSHAITNSRDPELSLLSNNTVSYNVANLQSFVTHSATMRSTSDDIVRLHGANFPVIESEMHSKLSEDNGYTREHISQGLSNAKLHKTPPLQRDNHVNNLQARDTNVSLKCTEYENGSLHANGVDDLSVQLRNYTREVNDAHPQVYEKTFNVTTGNTIEPMFSTGNNCKSVIQPFPDMEMTTKGKQYLNEDISAYTHSQDGIESITHRNIQTKMLQYFPNVEGKWHHDTSQSENQVSSLHWTQNDDEQEHLINNGLEETIPLHAEYLPKFRQEGRSYFSSKPMEKLSYAKLNEDGPNSLFSMTEESIYQMEFITRSSKLNSGKYSNKEPSFDPYNKKIASTSPCPPQKNPFPLFAIRQEKPRPCGKSTTSCNSENPTCVTSTHASENECQKVCPSCGEIVVEKSDRTHIGEKFSCSDEKNGVFPNALINICFRCDHEGEHEAHQCHTDTQTQSTCICYNKRPKTLENRDYELTITMDENMRKEIAKEVRNLLTEHNLDELSRNCTILQAHCPPKINHTEVKCTEFPKYHELPHYIAQNNLVDSVDPYSEINHKNVMPHITNNSSERATSNFPNKEGIINDADDRIRKIVKSKAINGDNSVSQNELSGSVPNRFNESRNELIKSGDKLVGQVPHLKLNGYHQNNQKNNVPFQSGTMPYYAPQISCNLTTLGGLPNHSPNRLMIDERNSHFTPESLFDIDLNNNDVLTGKNNLWWDTALLPETPKLFSKGQNYESENVQEFVITNPTDTKIDEIAFHVGSGITYSSGDQDNPQDVYNSSIVRRKRSSENDNNNKESKEKSVKKKSSFNLLYGGPVYRKPHHRMFNPASKNKIKDEKNSNKVAVKKVTPSEAGDLVRKARHAKRVPIRQVSANGMQIRGGQDCNDNSTPPCVNPKSYHESAHCLRFSDLWYTVYKVQRPKLEHTISVQLFEKHTLSDGGVYWRDLTKGTVLSVGTSNSHVMDETPTLSITYKTAKALQPPYTIDPEQNRLLIPQSVPMNKLDMYPQLQAGPNEYLVLKTKDISFDGENCDRSGVGFSAFAKQSNRCGKPKGTCLKNQPVDFWRKDIEARLNGKKGSYFLENIGMLPPKPMRTNSTNDESILLLEYQGAYTSTMEVEVKADHNTIVRTGVLARISWVLVDSTVAEMTLLTVTVTNLALASSPFLVSLSDCDPSAPENWDNQKTRNMTIPPQFSHDFRLKLSGKLPEGSFDCTVSAVNHRKAVVAKRKARFQTGDRCICLWHCLCACLSTATAMPCEPITTQDYQAAGFQDSIPVITGAAMGNLFYAFWANFIVFGLAMLIILLCLGCCKGCLGITCCPAVGAWGLGLLVDQSRRIPHYYEKHLQDRPVFYDENGYPVHPDTKERSVRTTSRCMELLLNCIFFLIFPIVILVAICRRCCGRSAKWDDPESGTCLRWMNTVVIGDQVKEEENCYCYNELEEEEDAKYAMNEMNRSQESLKALQGNSQESEPLIDRSGEANRGKDRPEKRKKGN